MHVWRGDRGCVADGLGGVLVGGVAVGAVVGAVDLWERGVSDQWAGMGERGGGLLAWRRGRGGLLSGRCGRGC